MVKSVKIILRRILPERCYKVLQRTRGRHQYRRVFRAITGGSSLVVQNGPFAKMVYVPHASEGAYLPRLLGSYEAELHGVLAEVFKTDYDVVIDIGCAEGYYAVGLAMRLPKARIYAFDTDPFARQLCEDMARANNVNNRIFIGGDCDIDQLRELALGRALIICDCEGCELALLRPDLVSGLRDCDILVELHDFIDPSISRTIISRFTVTHDITLLRNAERDPNAYPQLRVLKAADQRLAVAEFRPEVMEWAFIKSKTSVC